MLFFQRSNNENPLLFFSKVGTFETFKDTNNLLASKFKSVIYRQPHIISFMKNEVCNDISKGSKILKSLDGSRYYEKK